MATWQGTTYGTTMEPTTPETREENETTTTTTTTTGKVNRYHIVTLVFGLLLGLEFLLLIYCLAGNDWIKGSFTGDEDEKVVVTYSLWKRCEASSSMGEVCSFDSSTLFQVVRSLIILSMIILLPASIYMVVISPKVKEKVDDNLMTFIKRVAFLSATPGILLVACPEIFKLGAKASDLTDVEEGPPFTMFIFLMAWCMVQTIIYIFFIGIFKAREIEKNRQQDTERNENFDWDHHWAWTEGQNRQWRFITTGKTWR